MRDNTGLTYGIPLGFFSHDTFTFTVLLIEMSPKKILTERWGYTAFRPGQEEVLRALLEGRDALAVFPTGGGKSLLYQLPPLVSGGVALVVSPLVALMEDQVGTLNERSIPALALHSGLSKRERDQAWTDIEFGKYSVVYLTPERLGSEMFLARVERFPVRLLAVDEAHCISEWGHDFRTAYREIATVRSLLSTPEGERSPVLAVTATATPEVRTDIREQLAMEDPLIEVHGFDRPNITLSVHFEPEKEAKLTEILEAVPGPAIVYAGTRRGCEKTAGRLEKNGISAVAYHAGLPADRRASVQQRWLNDEVRVIVATSAFGMGIDKPDVRVVVHTALPGSLEAYYQEAGRAGRGGRRSYAVLLVGRDDDALPRALAEQSHPDVETINAVYSAVGSLGQIAVGSRPEEPQIVDIGRVVQATGGREALVRSAIGRVAETGAWDVLPVRGNDVCFRMVVSPEVLREHGAQSKNKAYARFLDRFQRALPAEAYERRVSMSLSNLTRKTGLEPTRLVRGLYFLQERSLIELVPPGEGLRIEWREARSRRLSLDVRRLKQAKARSEKRLDYLVRYVETPACRRRFILAYFGESAKPTCGACDRCLGRHRRDLVLPEDEDDLASLLHAIASPDSRRVKLDNPRRSVLVDWLTHEGLVRLRDPLEGTFQLTAAGEEVLTRLGKGERENGGVGDRLAET